MVLFQMSVISLVMRGMLLPTMSNPTGCESEVITEREHILGMFECLLLEICGCARR